jgi:hypothetical protein
VIPECCIKHKNLLSVGTNLAELQQEHNLTEKAKLRETGGRKASDPESWMAGRPGKLAEKNRVARWRPGF